jgi:hypothetical protein
MAGAGYRTWTAGEVVTASNVQSYLQDQTVGVYAGTAARSSAILSPSEGQVSYRTDDDIVEVYNGSAWTPVAPTNSGLIHINETTVTNVTAVNFNNVFSATYSNYMVTFEITSANSQGVNLRMRAGGVDASGANYAHQLFSAQNTTLSGARSTGQTSGEFAASRTAGRNTGVLNIFNPFEALETTYMCNNHDPLSTVIVFLTAGNHSLANSYDGFTILAAANISGTFRVYGLRN